MTAVKIVRSEGKTVTGSGKAEGGKCNRQTRGERDRQRQTEREIDSDRGRDRRAV